jgi:Phage tail protein
LHWNGGGDLQKITFYNSIGDSIISSSYGRPFFLSRIGGLGDVDAETQTQKSPGQDGSSPVKPPVLKERHITLEIDICEEYESNRLILSKIFNPKFGEGLLVYENEFVKREIKALSEHVPSFPDVRPSATKKALIDLIAYDPFWLTEEQAEQLIVWEGGLEFPLELPTTFAEQSGDKSKILVNEGDAPTPIEVTFNGPATSPIQVINLTTGEFIKVKQSLLKGERLEINTAFGQKRVSKVLTDGNIQNAFHFITLDSTFFSLQLGNNLIDYSTGEDYERAAVSISWRNRHVSV